jgi:hypothetical protein
MVERAIIIVALISSMILPSTPTRSAPLDEDIRFEAVDIYIDPDGAPLAAYQFELSEATGRSVIVGVEGGEEDTFATAPYYDARALNKGLIIIAAFTTSEDGPTAETRVARVHMQVEGWEDSEYTLKLTVAGQADGRTIDAKADYVVQRP